MRDDPFTGRSERDPATGAVEEPRAQLAFDALDPAAEMSGGYIMELCGPPEMQLVCERDEATQRLDIHSPLPSAQHAADRCVLEV